MKTRTLAAVVILICSFLLAPGLLRADENEWYQGQQGDWYNEQDGWRWRSNNGNEYRKTRSGWAWAYHKRNPQTDRRTFQQFKEQQ